MFIEYTINKFQIFSTILTSILGVQIQWIRKRGETRGYITVFPFLYQVRQENNLYTPFLKWRIEKKFKNLTEFKEVYNYKLC